MYSPKIAEHLIPPIYWLARARGQHMTTLVNEALARYLADQGAGGAPPAAPRPSAHTVDTPTGVAGAPTQQAA